MLKQRHLVFHFSSIPRVAWGFTFAEALSVETVSVVSDLGEPLSVAKEKMSPPTTAAIQHVKNRFHFLLSDFNVKADADLFAVFFQCLKFPAGFQVEVQSYYDLPAGSLA